MSEHNEKTCRDVKCTAAHVHYKTLANGDRVAVVRVRSNNVWHVAKFKLPPGVRELEKV